MAVTTHHRQRYVTLTNTTQLWGDRCGRKEMTPKCPQGPGGGVSARWQLHAGPREALVERAVE